MMTIIVREDEIIIIIRIITQVKGGGSLNNDIQALRRRKLNPDLRFSYL